MTFKISALSSPGKTLDGLKVMVSGLPGALFTAHRGGVDVLDNVLQGGYPDLVFLDLPAHADKDMRQLETILLGRPDTWLVLLSPDHSADFLMQAMRAGCLLYTSPSPRDYAASRMPSSA